MVAIGGMSCTLTWDCVVKWFDPSLCQFGTVQKHLVDILPKVTCFNDLGAKLHYLLVDDHNDKIKHVEEISQEPTKNMSYSE